MLAQAYLQIYKSMSELDLIREFGSPNETQHANNHTPQTLEQAAQIIEANADAMVSAEEAENAKTRDTLETLLKGVEIEPPPGYIPSEFALNFVTFIKLCNGAEGEENKTPPIHYYMLDGFAGASDRIAIMVFRGAAKTTLFEYLILYLAVFGEMPGIGKLNSIVYMSDTIDNGIVNMQKNLQHRYDSSEFLRAQIPQAKLLKVSWEFKNISGHTFIVKGFGAASGFRGFKVLGKRPKLALLDDLISDSMAESDIEMRKVENIIKRGVQPALNPICNKIIWAGTPFNERDPLCKAVVSGAWEVFMFPVCQKFPCTRAEFIGAWDDRFTYDYVKRQHEIAVKGGESTEFFRELMLQTVSDEDRLVDIEEDIGWYDLQEQENYQGAKEILITTDLSFSGTSTADSAIIDVWELRPNEDVLWIGGMSEKTDITTTIDLLFRFIEHHKAYKVGVEISGQQVAMIRLLEQEMERRDIYFHLVGEKGKSKDQKGIRPVSNKLVRFKQVLPMIKRRKLKFPRERQNDQIIQEKLHQLNSVTLRAITSKEDDALDSISMLGLIELIFPSKGEVDNSENRNYNLDPAIWGEDAPEDDAETYYDRYLV